MALGRDIIDAIIREHSYCPINGDVLLVGPQTMAMSRHEVMELVHNNGVNVGALREQSISGSEDSIGCTEFFTLLGANSVLTLDSREGSADVVHNLGIPIPDGLEASADFIVDAGSITNIFSPVAALRNYASLLRNGGRLLAINNLSSHYDPYSTPSALWYLDYFVVNRFADCKVYVLVYEQDRPSNAFCVNIECLLDPKREVRSFLSSREMAIVLFAEKSAKSTIHETPVHPEWRSPTEWDNYWRGLERIKRSERPHLVRSRGHMNFRDVRGGYLFMKKDFAAVEPPEAAREADGN
jgi:hypothetical protein